MELVFTRRIAMAAINPVVSETIKGSTLCLCISLVLAVVLHASQGFALEPTN